MKKYRVFFKILIIVIIAGLNFQVMAYSVNLTDPDERHYVKGFDPNKENKMPKVKLGFSNYSLECIFSDGGLYKGYFGFNGSGIANTQKIDRISYNLEGIGNNSSPSSGNLLYYNSMKNDPNNNTDIQSCPTKLYSVSYKDNTYYRFNSKYEVTYDEDGKVKSCNLGYGTNVENSWCARQWWCLSDYDNNSEECAKAVNNQANYNLISERYILNNAPQTATLYYLLPKEQASGVNSYIKIYLYSNVILLEKNDRVTILDGEIAEAFKNVNVYVKNNGETVVTGLDPKYENIYINSPEPVAVTNSASTISYKFNSGQTRYSFSTSQDSTHSEHYILTDKVPDNGDMVDNSLCDDNLKNTAPIVRKIIGILQILMPALVIVLTSLEIGKIVINGNIDEELPKRRKNIIARLIVVAVFLFLPLLTRVFVNVIKSTGAKNVEFIKDIGCLFEDE